MHYNLATALRGPDYLSDGGMTQSSTDLAHHLESIKRTVTARLRVVAYGNQMDVPGHYNATPLTQRELGHLDLSIQRVRYHWSGWRHFCTHLVLALQHPEVREHPVFGGLGSELMHLLAGT